MGPNVISDIEYKLTEYKSYQIQKKPHHTGWIKTAAEGWRLSNHLLKRVWGFPSFPVSQLGVVLYPVTSGQLGTSYNHD